jgi:hypothetical protein
MDWDQVGQLSTTDWLVVLGGSLGCAVLVTLILWPSGKHREPSNGGAFFLFLALFAVAVFLGTWIYTQVELNN